MLADVYNNGDDRSFTERDLTSFGLGSGVTVARAGGVRGGALRRRRPVGFVARWVAALALLFNAVWLLLRYAPPRPGPHRWISFGSACA